MSKYKLFQWCPVKKKVVPIEQVARRAQTNARDLFIQDEMEPTRNPLNPKEIYTSKSKLRAAYRAAGAIEVGDAYDRGYQTDKESGASERKLAKDLTARMIERYKNER
ncbi:hypothetical protein EBZ38_12975 [bacterium]|nr:hypothetical protein [bacterium]